MLERELEQQIIHRFEEAGWNVKIPKPIRLDNSRAIYPDIEIFDGDTSFGYVEVKSSLKPEILLKKIDQWKLMVRELKPKLFIITDGVEYHVSVYGNKFDVIYFPPSPKSYHALIGLVNEYVDFCEKKGGNK